MNTRICYKITSHDIYFKKSMHELHLLITQNRFYKEQGSTGNVQGEAW